MARRPAFLRECDPAPARIEKHMMALGLPQTQAYLDWCWANGFEASFDKKSADMLEELEAHAAQQKRKADQAKLHRKPKAFLRAVFAGDLTADEIDRPIFKEAATEIENSAEDPGVRASLLEMLLALTAHGKFVFETLQGTPQVPVLRGLIKLHDRKALWLRPLEDWKAKSKNTRTRFGELARHLFDKYGDVPVFMESAWLRNDRPSWRYRDWFVHLGRGYNLRSAKLPIAMTKKMAHHFASAPDDYAIEQALRWGQMKALGCSEAAIHAVAASRIGRSMVNEEFWFTFLRFIADNPMLDPRQIAPVIDYLHHQRFEPVEVEVAPGEWRHDPPPQPGLSLRGRTVTTLMRQVEEWHTSLGKMAALPGGQYAKSSVEGFVQEVPWHEGGTARWVIRQLRTARDLTLESEELRHCVGSYHWSCSKGYCTIWSLSVTPEKGKTQRRQTIELDSDNQIVQCRGLANRDPSAEEWKVVNRWAGERGLGVARHI
ncbi:MAG: PcfJ domain-containing protein [Pseudomonadota bacterium]